MDPAEQQRQAERLRQIAVADVVTKRMTVISTAAYWGLLAADVQRWVNAAEEVGEVPGVVKFPETPPPSAP